MSFLSLRPNAIPCPRLMAMGFSESDVISVLQKIFASQDPRIHLGIGDDAAVVATSPRSVISSDMAVEGVHFKTEWSSPFDIGRKITAANVADILAMGGRCEYLVAAVSLTGTEEISWIENLARGMQHEATLAGAVIVGGDIARASQIVIAMTAVGTASQPITRSGAQWVTPFISHLFPVGRRQAGAPYSRNFTELCSGRYGALAIFCPNS